MTARWSIAPYFIVDDVVATANFYRDKLGFHYDRFWGDPPAFCMVKRGGIIIMLSQLETTGVMRPNRLAATMEMRGTPTSGSTTRTRCTRSSRPRA